MKIFDRYAWLALAVSLLLTVAARAGNGNLLDLAIGAARVRATVGEISDALEQAYGRYRARTESVSGVYGAAFADDGAWKELQRDVARFAEDLLSNDPSEDPDAVVDVDHIVAVVQGGDREYIFVAIADQIPKGTTAAKAARTALDKVLAKFAKPVVTPSPNPSNVVENLDGTTVTSDPGSGG